MKSTKFGSLLLVTIVAASPAPAKPPQLIGNWAVGYDNGLCMLWRNYGSGTKQPTSLIVEPSLTGGATRVFIMHPGRPGPGRWGAGWLRVDGTPTLDIQTLDFPTNNKDQRILEITVPPEQLAPVLKASRWELRSKHTGYFKFELGALAGTMPQLEACVAKRIAQWGLDRASQARLAELAKGEVSKVFSDEDYPKVSILFDREGSTTARLLVGLDGRVIDCSIVISSGDAVLDHATCDKIKSRVVFTPAKTESGKPAFSIVDQTVHWAIH